MLLLTLMMLVLLTFEVAVISLVAQRGLGEEGMLQSQHIAARRGGETVLHQLENALYTYLQANDGAAAETAFNYGGSNYIAQSDLMITPPGGGADIATDVKVTAWVSARRGVWYKLTARAQDGSVDLLVHRWIKLNPCKTQSTLTTIITGRNKPGWYEALRVASNGRVYFGEQNNPGNFYTWHPDTGLSTITSGTGSPASGTWDQDTKIDIASDDQVYWGDNNGVYTYTTTNGLSTIALSGSTNYVYVSTGKRLYWGDSWGSNAFTWHANTGLSTILTTAGAGATAPAFSDSNRKHGAAYGPVYDDFAILRYGDTFWKWHITQGLSTMFSTAAGREAGPVTVRADGTVIARSYYSPTQFFVWKNNTFTTLAADCNDCSSGVFIDDGRYMGGSYGGLFQWNDTPGLSTILAWNGGADARVVRPGDGLMYWGNWQHMFRWSLTEGLSTIADGAWLGSGPAREGGIKMDNATGTIYFTNDSAASSLYRYHTSTGLSTLYTSTDWNEIGSEHSMAYDQNTKRLYFGEDVSATGKFGTWHETTGLSTILTGLTNLGNESTAIAPGKGVYFGQDASPGNFYYWEPPADCSERGF